MFNKMKKLQDAIHRNDATQVTNISSKMGLYNKSEYYDLCVLAVQNNKIDALKALLLGNYCFYFTHSNGDSRKLLNEALSSPDPVAILSALYEINKKTDYGKLDANDFFNKDSPFEFILSQLRKDPKLFADCIDAVLDSAEKLEIILNLAAETGSYQSIINNALEQAARRGKIDAARMLLNRGATPNVGKGRALLCAGERGHQDMVDLLLPLVKPAFCGYVAIQLQDKDSASEAIISALEAAAQAAAPQPQQENAEDGFSAVDENTLCLTQTMPDGARLTTIFNLLLEQQQAYAKAPGAALPGPVTTESLDKETAEKLRPILNGLNEKKASPTPTLTRLRR